MSPKMNQSLINVLQYFIKGEQIQKEEYIEDRGFEYQSDIQQWFDEMSGNAMSLELAFMVCRMREIEAVLSGTIQAERLRDVSDGSDGF